MNPNTPALFFPVLIGLAILVGALVFYQRRKSRTRRLIAELSNRVDVAETGQSLITGNRLEGSHQGIFYSCRYSAGSKNNPPSLTITARITCPAGLTLRHEAWYDRFARRIGLVAEVQTGDPAFDSAYFLDTDRADIILPFFSDETKRRAVDALFALGHPVREIVFGKDDLRLVLSPFPQDALADFPLSQYLTELQKLSGNQSSAGYASAFDPRMFPGNPRYPLSKGALALVFAINGLLILGGAFALAYGMSEHEPLGHQLIVNALSLSVAVTLFYLILVFRWIRGRSSSHRYFLIILILSLIGFPLGLTGGAIVTNGIFDRGEETQHHVPVTRLYYQKNKNGRTYYLAFPSWQKPDDVDRLSIPLNLYRVLRPGREIIIRTKPGYWREEWIVGLEPSDEPVKRPDTAGGFPLRLKSIRFYEGGSKPVPAEKKKFAAEFPRGTSRYIHCQVNMENDYWNIKDQAYTFVWQYIYPDGSVHGKVSMPFTVRKDWYRAWVSHSWGGENPGNWPAGNYRVAVFVNDRLFGEGRFTIR